MENRYFSFMNNKTEQFGIENKPYKLSEKHIKRLSDVLSELKRLPISEIVLYGSCARTQRDMTAT